MGGSVPMLNNSDQIIISGREFSQKELETVVETINMFSDNFSRTELARTICVHLDWYTATGNYKRHSAWKLMERLEEKNLVELPEVRDKKTTSMSEIEITSKTAERAEITGTVSDYSPITLKKVKNKENRDLWNEYIERYHDLGYKFPFGARQRYFIKSEAEDNPERLGCLLFSAAAWSLEKRDKWIGWEEEHRSKYLNGIVNNTRFLIFPWVKIKNLASKALSLAVNRIRSDWKKRYNYKPVLLETFVDKEKYTGTCYKAANWKYLGETKGRGRQDRNKEYLSSVKLIYVYPLVDNFREYLLGDRPEWGVNQ